MKIFEPSRNRVRANETKRCVSSNNRDFSKSKFGCGVLSMKCNHICSTRSRLGFYLKTHPFKCNSFRFLVLIRTNKAKQIIITQSSVVKRKMVSCLKREKPSAKSWGPIISSCCVESLIFFKTEHSLASLL